MFRPFKALFLGTLLSIFVVAWPALSTAQVTPSDLQTKLDQSLVDYSLVGIGVAVYAPDLDEPIVVVAGERKRGSGNLIKPDDPWHIGSNSKMLTALTYAKLVADGRAEWGATLPTFFPELSADIHSDWTDVAIEDLLAHRSGIEPNPDQMWMIARMFDSNDLATQRRELIQKILTSPVKGEKGAFSYSNSGYMLAGAIIEGLSKNETNPSFEDTFRSLFADDFEEIGGSIGFGPPKDGIEGHRKGLFGSKLNGVGDSDQADNPAIFGPAGTMHVDLRTHTLFLAEHFIFGDEKISAKLLTPYPDAAADYALGWGTVDMDGLGQVFSHSGSNTMWLSNISYVPSLDTIVIININQFNADARNAVRDLSRDILTELAADRP